MGHAKKVEVELPDELLARIDEIAAGKVERSEVVERAIRAFLVQPQHGDPGARDLEIIDRYADELNHEAEEVLAFQVLQ